MAASTVRVEAVIRTVAATAESVPDTQTVTIAPSTPTMTDDTLPVAPPTKALAPIALRFTGSGSEYFRIWIVNLALTFVTFGIYSAWAKVRRLQYFYRNTQLDGSGFDYHGSPIAILKGRLMAFGMFAAYNFLKGWDSTAALVMAVVIGAVLPWLLVRSLAFRMRNSSWRALRFRFNGDVAGGYKVFLLWPIVSVLTLGLLAPAAYNALKSYQHGNTAFGTAPFTFSATVRDFYRLCLRTAILFGGIPLALLLLAGVNGVLSRSAVPAMSDLASMGFWLLLEVGVFALYFALLLAMPYFLTRSQNLIWNHTALGPHRFECRLRVRTVLWLYVSNFFLTVVTLGLFRPFAVVRMARYRAESMTLVPGESLDQFVGTQSRDVAALGEELSEFLDIDIAL